MTDGETAGRAAETVDPISLERPVYEADVPFIALAGLGALVVGIVLVLSAIDRAQQLLGLAALAGVLAAILAPAIARIGQAIGQVAASVVIHLVVLVLLAAGTAVVIQEIRSEAASLENYAAEQLQELEEGGGPTLLNRSGLSQRVGDAAASWGTIAVVGDDEAAGIATRLSQLLVIVVLSIFLTLQSDRVLSTVLGWSKDRERRRILREVWTNSVAMGSCHLRRTLVVAVGSGMAAAALGASFGLAGVILLGVWAGLLSAVPLLGTLVGWAPLVAVSMAVLPRSQAAAVLILAVLGVAATNLFRSKFVVLEVQPGSFIVAVGIAAGLSAAGLPGAAAGLFLAVAAATAATHDWSGIRTSSPLALEQSPDGAGGVALLSSDRRLFLRPSRETALQIAVLVILAFMIQLSISRVGPTLVWALVGVLIAIGLDRPVSWIERRWGIRRSITVVVGAIVIALAVGALVATARGSVGAATSMDDEVPQLVDSLEGLPLIGDRLADENLTSEIGALQRRAPSLLNRSPMAGRAVSIVGGGLVGAFWVLVATMTGLLDGPRLISAIDRRVPARFRRQVSRLAGAGRSALAGYVAGSALVAGINGVLIGMMATVAGVPMPAILALWAFSWNFIPQVGALIGWAPFLFLTLAEGPVTAAVCLGAFVVYQAVENNLIQPSIVGHAVNISPLAALGAALFGAAVGGLIGAVLAIPTVGVIHALNTEWNREDFPSLRRPKEQTSPPIHPVVVKS